MPQTIKTYVGNYKAEIDFPKCVIYGNNNINAIRIFQALQVDPRTILHVDSETQIEAYWNMPVDQKRPDRTFTVIFANCDVSETFRNKYQNEMLFIHPPEGLLPAALAVFFADATGVTGFKNIRFDAAADTVFSFGQANQKIKHGKLELIMRFQNELRKWVAAGKPYRTDEQVAEIFDTFCAKCSEFIATPNKPEQGRCNICGCNILRNNKDATARIFNKLALATCRCPKDPPLWSENVTVPDEDIKGRETALYNAYLAEAKLATPAAAQKSGGGGCGCGKKVVNGAIADA